MFPTFSNMNTLRTLNRPAKRLSLDNASAARVSPESVLLNRASSDDEDGPAVEAVIPGHAVDVLQLLDNSWFGVTQHRRRQTKSNATSSPSWHSSRETSSPTFFQQRLPARSSKSSLLGEPNEGSAGGSVSSGQAQGPENWHPSQEGENDSLVVTKQPREVHAVQQLPGIGTWAGRQRLFARPADLRSSEQKDCKGCAEPDALVSSAEPEPILQHHKNDNLATSATPEDAGILSARSSLRSEHAKEAAWRWRFTRKWEAEQRKYYEDGAASQSLMSNDDMDAIQYTQACGMGMHLQFAGAPLHRTISRQSDYSGTLPHSLSCQFDVSGHGGSGALSALAAASATGAPQDQHPRQQRWPLDADHQEGAAQGEGLGVAAAQGARGAQEGSQASATTAVMSMFTKAHDLLQKQRQLELEAQSRWEHSMDSSSDGPWAGKHLCSVQIGMSGRFRFVVFRVGDSRGHQRFVVRGRRGATPAQLAEDLSREAVLACRRHRLPQMVIDPVGGGMMDWREDTDRHLYVSSAPNSLDSLDGLVTSSGEPYSPKKGSASGDVAGLAASLVRQALPCHFQVSTANAGRHRA